MATDFHMKVCAQSEPATKIIVAKNFWHRAPPEEFAASQLVVLLPSSKKQFLQ
jgi:hypothetical protein